MSIISSGYGTDFDHSLDVAVETLVDLPAASTAPEYVVDPNAFDLHVGDYDDPHTVGAVNITRQGDTLYVEMPLLDGAGYVVSPTLQPVSSDIFLVTIDGYPYDLTFIPTEPGGDSIYIRNRAFVATRTQPGVQAAPSAAPSKERIDAWLKRRGWAHAPGPQKLLR